MELVNQLKNDYSYIFQNQNYPGLPKVNLKIVNEKFTYKGIEVPFIQAFHYKLKILGYRIKDFTYLTDVKTLEENEIKKYMALKY